MNSVSINSIRETVITLSFDQGVIAFDNLSIQFFKENFSSQIELEATLYSLFPSSLAAKLSEKMSYCRARRIQFHAYSEKKHSAKFHFSLSPILSRDQSIDSVSMVIEKNNPMLDKTQEVIIQELNYNSQLYTNLFYNNPDAVFLFDRQGNFINVNAQSALLAETTEEALLQMHFLPFLPESEHKYVQSCFERSLSGESLNYHCNFITKKGNHRILEIKNFPIIFEQEIIGVYGIAKNITEKLEIERKRSADKQMMRAIIDNIPDYIFVKDRNNRSILTNKKFANNILGLDTLKENSEITPLDYFEEDMARLVIEDNEAVMSSGEAVHNRQDIIEKKDGSREMVLLTKVPLKDEDKQVIGLVGIARNNTEAFLQNKRKDLILRILKAFGDKRTFQEATIDTLEILCKDLEYDYAEAYQVSVNNTELVKAVHWPGVLASNIEDRDLSRYKKDIGLPGKVWASKNIEIIQEVHQSSILEDMSRNAGLSIKTAVGVPITLQGKLICVLCFGSKVSKKRIEKSIYTEVSIQVASAMDRKLSQNQLSDFFEFSPNLIAVIGLDGFIKMANPAFVKTFNYTKEEILVHPISYFIDPDDLDKTFEAINRTSIAGEDFEIRCRQKSGQYIWISWRFSRFFENENIVYIYGTNVTAIKNHEIFIRNSEKRFKALVQEGSDHIAILDKDLKFIYNSPGTEQLYGLTIDELLNTELNKRVFEEDWQQVSQLLKELKEGERHQLPSYRVQDTNHKIHWIETIATNLSNDSAVGGIVLNSRDITEFILQERQLIESLKRYDIVAKATSDIITDYDIATQKMKASEAFHTVFGWESKDGIYESTWWNEKIHPHDHLDVRNAAQDLKDQRRHNLTIEYRFRCADGSYKYVLDRSQLMLDENGEPVRIIGSLQDITERKNHLIAIQGHNKRLKDIAWTQSHVVRAPLAKIMGLVDLMMNYREDLDNIDEILENILISANELDGIIREISVKTENEL